MILRLHDVSQRFARRWVLQRLTLGVPEGAAVLLTGENGAGKTTLLRVMATALKPTRGRLELFAQDAWTDAARVRPRLGLMTHEHYLYENLSAHENLSVVHGLSGRGSVEAIVPLLEKVGLGAFLDVPVATYSAGMKRRLALARLLLGDPALVLLDEPFGQLDPGGVKLMESLITQMRAAGKTLVISTHDVERAAALCSTRLHLENGRAQGGGLQPIGGGAR